MSCQNYDQGGMFLVKNILQLTRKRWQLADTKKNKIVKILANKTRN